MNNINDTKFNGKQYEASSRRKQEDIQSSITLEARDGPTKNEKTLHSLEAFIYEKKAK